MCKGGKTVSELASWAWRVYNPAMCLILVANRCRPDYPLVVAANRDEYYDRPTAALSFWDDHPQVAAGRDLKEGGTWLGVTRGGRFAAVTNFRDPARVNPSARSRGELVREFLVGTNQPFDYLSELKDRAGAYNPFNLIVGDRDTILYYSNVEGKVSEVPPGIHGLSNRLLDTPWPKVEKGKSALDGIVRASGPISIEDLFSLLSDENRPPDSMLPDTGVGMEWERALSPIFIRTPVYGTRSSSVIVVDSRGKCLFAERSFSPGSTGELDRTDRVIEFEMEGAELLKAPSGG